MNTVYVKPRPGGRVRMPDRNCKPMDPKGDWVPRIDYYERLIITGDLIITDPPPRSPPQSEPSEPPQGGSSV
ncbi:MULTISPECIES: DUF2635 domain-containing protein [unclassified Bradyrhizobium]|uniref:DUF2635 domain-containing protein n=1 Tax=unclassified Bradyrhizobium TaxID=2631580 RepID=UPI0028E92A67|nr:MULTISPECIES: DUF2635 domain-containing protein [unclassified Bradyrhizobium]